MEEVLVSGESLLSKLGIDIGTKRIHMKTITEADIVMFSGVSGDTNPLHLCEEYAKKTMFKGRIAHGILTLGLISAALAKFPGTIIYLSQNARFTRPVRPGDSITAIAEVIEKNEEKSIVKLRTTCVNQNNETVIEGEATIMVREPPE